MMAASQVKKQQLFLQKLTFSELNLFKVMREIEVRRIRAFANYDSSALAKYINDNDLGRPVRKQRRMG